MGAAVGTVLSEAIVALYQTLSVRKELDIRGYLSKALLYIIPGMVMYFVILIIINTIDKYVINPIPTCITKVITELLNLAPI